jgi:hypothetical protein
MPNPDIKNQVMEEVEEILNEIIAAEDNSEHIVEAWKDSYLVRIKNAVSSLEATTEARVVGEIREKVENAKDNFAPVDGEIDHDARNGAYTAFDYILALLQSYQTSHSK